MRKLQSLVIFIYWIRYSPIYKLYMYLGMVLGIDNPRKPMLDHIYIKPFYMLENFKVLNYILTIFKNITISNQQVVKSDTPLYILRDYEKGNNLIYIFIIKYTILYYTMLYYIL